MKMIGVCIPKLYISCVLYNLGYLIIRNAHIYVLNVTDISSCVLYNSLFNTNYTIGIGIHIHVTVTLKNR